MKIKTLLTLLTVLTIGASCEKDIYGCTDATAVNYNTEATEDDGTCTYNYTADLSIWFNSSFSETMLSYGIETLTIYLDDVSVGTMDMEKWVVGPECNGPDRLTLTMEIGNNDLMHYDLVARDESGVSREEKSITIYKDECTSIQLY